MTLMVRYNNQFNLRVFLLPPIIFTSQAFSPCKILFPLSKQWKLICMIKLIRIWVDCWLNERTILFFHEKPVGGANSRILHSKILNQNTHRIGDQIKEF